MTTREPIVIPQLRYIRTSDSVYGVVEVVLVVVGVVGVVVGIVGVVVGVVIVPARNAESEVSEL